MRSITLITDYGTRDHYVGVLKGVITGIAADVRVMDITHEIEPHNIAHAAFVLRQTWPWYPAGTVHLVVVDPGVGTERRIIVGKYAGQFVVAPDNGIVGWVHEEMGAEALHAVENDEFFLPQVSSTFHGRDVMAPVAAHLAGGVAPSRLGPPIKGVERLPIPVRAEISGDRLSGRVIYVDHFGNLVTNIHAEQLSESRTYDVLVDHQGLGPIRKTFADVPVGQPVAYLGSSEYLEIAVNQGRASASFERSASICVHVTD